MYKPVCQHLNPNFPVWRIDTGEEEHIREHQLVASVYEDHLTSLITDVYLQPVGHVQTPRLQSEHWDIIIPAYWITARTPGMIIPSGMRRLGNFDSQGRYHSAWTDNGTHKMSHKLQTLVRNQILSPGGGGHMRIVVGRQRKPISIYFAAKTEEQAAAYAHEHHYSTNDLWCEPHEGEQYTYWPALGKQWQHRSRAA